MKTLIALFCLTLSAFGGRTFDGSTSSITGVLTPSYPFSVACWFKVANVTADHCLIAITNTASTNYYLALYARGTVAGDPIVAAAKAGTTSFSATSTSFAANTWQHACAVFNSDSDRRVYLNGGGKGTDATTKTMVGLDITSIGRIMASTPILPTNGTIAEVGMWNVGLTDADAASLAAGFSPLLVRPQGLVFYAPLSGSVRDWKGLSLTDNSTTGGEHPRVFRSAGVLTRKRAGLLASWMIPVTEILR